ncbi:MAG: M18 family aminopeptidase [Victivallales bacterium]|nr:M18 family aminopeptidase [Victivallales bacterium]
MQHDILEFLTASYTPYHAVGNLAMQLQEAGFRHLEESAHWELQPGDCGFVVRGGALIAFRLSGARQPESHGFRIALAHTDSPSLKLKLADAKGGKDGEPLRIPVEVYGGPILSTWLDRPLGLAGRIAVMTDDGPVAQLIASEGPLAVIPNPPPHFANTNSGHFSYNAQENLAALFDAPDLASLYELILSGMPLQPSKTLPAAELHLYSTMPAQLIGLSSTPYIQGAHIDDLSSCHSIIEALLASPVSAETQVAALFNLEEVGQSFDSAGSNFLPRVLSRIAHSFSAEPDATTRMLANSQPMLSIDVAHAFNPNFASFYDPGYAPKVGGGPALKLNAQLRYATTVLGEAFFQQIAEKANVPTQVFEARSDMPCGGTIGPITAASLGIPAIDMGIPIWAMHSLRETASIADVAYLTRFVQAYWEL